jgi:hypothetical protein
LEWKKAEGTGFEKHKKKASKKRQISQIYRPRGFELAKELGFVERITGWNSIISSSIYR